MLHYFSYFGGTGTDMVKSAPRNVTPNLCFLHLVGSAGHVVHYGASGERNINTLFFMHRWDWYGLDKKRVRSHYAKFVFWHPVASTGHVVHFGASGAHNIDALFFMLGWDRYGYDKNTAGTR
jgi:hypothetical protein